MVLCFGAGGRDVGDVRRVVWEGEMREGFGGVSQGLGEKGVCLGGLLPYEIPRAVLVAFA